MRGMGRVPEDALSILRRLYSSSQLSCRRFGLELPWRNLVALLVESCGERPFLFFFLLLPKYLHLLYTPVQVLCMSFVRHDSFVGWRMFPLPTVTSRMTNSTSSTRLS